MSDSDQGRYAMILELWQKVLCSVQFGPGISWLPPASANPLQLSSPICTVVRARRIPIPAVAGPSTLHLACCIS